ncbi:metalloregulator ArsR/SmtB family transcription factor [Lacticaseibacillus pabuli]|uniref:Metalloregulator ArsR/SmtB family transcription factor n=1 Tax=Lacticaseibacillus pabuli TaxID=3025672 RepID=A0ABY7WMU9_9LACO|nr:metalloregulator ArsR/SmtB family transcription factor [Lacticaseibacillus sp. KACC 23028]WDF81538.1 metalloregulator ArsR/SmtB family transcription factor [Lacticaseibacillus sp. KACC 23028]
MNIKQSISNDEWRVKIFKALADEQRLAVIRELTRHSDPVAYAKISDLLGTGKSMISYHLKMLREAGLIEVTRNGQQKFITLNRKVFAGVLPGFLQTL